METKNYNLVTFFDDELPTDLYLVDMKRKKILLFQMYRECKDVTAATKRMYETDQKKSWSDRRIGCDLIDMMNHRSYNSAHIILSTDDAREVTRKIAAVRAKWFASHARCLESQAKSELAGWSRSADEAEDDAFVAKQFTNL
jgi:L-rhamnose mutarotase